MPKNYGETSIEKRAYRHVDPEYLEKQRKNLLTKGSKPAVVRIIIAATKKCGETIIQMVKDHSNPN